jgi:hypothetical protein
MDLFAKLMETPEEVIETPVKPDESPIANKIIQGATERPKPKIIPKKHKPEPALSDNDWEEIDESWEKDEKKYWKELKELKEVEERLEYTPPSKSWGPNREAVSPSSQEMTTQEIAYGCERQEDFLDHIFREIIENEPMDWLETQKRWEETWRKMGKEWQQQAMERRRKEQDMKSRWNLFYGLTGMTPPWSKLNPREPEPWEPKF